METNRLTPMKEGYDKKMFESLYSKTRNLTKSLVNQIDCHRFGVDKEEVQSWFDVKFLFVFNKYCDKYNEEVLLGHIISSLQFYKYRVMRQAYNQKAELQRSTIPLEDYHYENDNYQDSLPDTPSSYYYGLLASFLKKKLSDNAFYLFELELNPPPFIIRRMNEMGAKNLQKIPDSVLLEYFELGFSKKAYKYISSVRQEIKDGIALSKKHFNKTAN